MLNKEEHLLAVLGEESGEVAQLVGKSLRFGHTDLHPKHNNTPNIDLLVNEVNDVLASMELLVEAGVVPSDWQSRSKIDKKKAKVVKYMHYAVELGTLEPFEEITSEVIEQVKDLLMAPLLKEMAGSDISADEILAGASITEERIKKDLETGLSNGYSLEHQINALKKVLDKQNGEKQ